MIKLVCDRVFKAYVRTELDKDESMVTFFVGLFDITVVASDFAIQVRMYWVDDARDVGLCELHV